MITTLRRHSILLLFFLLVFPFAGHAEEGGFRFDRDRSSVIIPVKVRNNLAVVPLFINDYGPLHFILDTGVNTTILTEPLLAPLLELDFDRNVLVFGLGGEGVVEAALATDVKITMQGITGRGIDLLVIPEDILSFSEVFGFPVHGIIGYDFLRHFPVEVSYYRETMRVFRNDDYKIRRRSTIVPIEIINGKPYIESTLVGSMGDTLYTHLLLDLGASHPIYLNKEYISLSGSTIRGFLGKGISGNLLGRMGRIEEVRIGGVRIDKPVVSYPDERFLEIHGQTISWEGLIGGGIIKRFTMILDYGNNRVVMRPGRNFNSPFHTNLSGIEVIARGTKMRDFIVHYVRPGSSGYEAGLMAGDRIVELNRHNYTDMTLDDLLDMLSSGVGDPIRITVKRDNMLFRKEFHLREDLL